ncbi:molybdate ABC transporter substrate-binding protein [Salinisphaera sp. LB1]|uniref:molybdate ABC transporter substrate-binding protein n=1 Tax=Salinisphaera sp. LB1 TaxID=2183911 RepID=UPI000D708857|nr:molybdate ABC transporter substrate-binding protein [Salinisphaera sp. LB1]AWN17832.1 Molybdenum ABC transporter, periplasmic molybdenum-binding protein ModA [Salinisphaera sp. LB1]
MHIHEGIVRRGLLALAVVALAAAGLAQSAWAEGAKTQDKPLIVFAAASLKNAMDGVAQAYDKSHDGADVKVSYAGSSTLARQIEAGAPADVYVSANQQWMDKLASDGLIDKSSRYNLLGNSLVLVAPKSSDVQVTLKKHVNLLAKLGQGNYLAMANTDAVPAGIYGKHALQWLGVWSRMQGHIAQGDDVRAALALVSRGESPLGVVYSSDAVADKGVRVVDTFPPASHKPIIYPAAATADSHNPQDADFLAFLKSDTAAKIFKRWGFKVVAGQ